MTVAYFGPEFTNTHYAALQRFGVTAELVAAESISAVVDLVEHKAVQYGVIPIENSTEGVIRETLDPLYRSTYKSPMKSSCRSSILWGSGSLDEVTAVYSHPQPLAQCRARLTHLPHATLVAAASTARAAAEVVGRRDDSGDLPPAGRGTLRAHPARRPY